MKLEHDCAIITSAINDMYVLLELTMSHATEPGHNIATTATISDDGKQMT